MRTAVLALLLMAGTAAAQIVGDSMQCFALSKRTTAELTGIKRRTVAVCVNFLSGEVLGALLTKGGRPACEVRGYLVTLNCADVTVCGQAMTVCL